jgi:hypothetical protein
MNLGVALDAQGTAPGGFIELSTSTAIRPMLSTLQISQFLPTGRGRFTFPAPYGTEGYRLTVPTDCGGNDCVNSVGYSYWMNINNHAGSNTMYMFLGLDRDKGGTGPTLFSLSKTSGAVTKIGSLFSANDGRGSQTGEGMYFSASAPLMLYVRNGQTLERFDVLAKTTTVVFNLDDATSLFGSSRSLWQVHSSNDDRVHSFTVRENGGSYDMLGCGVYLETSRQFKYFKTIRGAYDECQVDRSGRWLLIKEDVDGHNGEDNRIIDLQTGGETVLLDEKGGMGHSDMGWGDIVGADNWMDYPGLRLWQFGTSPVGPGTVVYRDPTWSTQSVEHLSRSNAVAGSLASQYACGSSATRTNGPRSNEVVCFMLDGSLKTLVVAPVMTNLDAKGGGDDYNKGPKGNLDVTGQYFIWTSNMGGSRQDAFIVRVPSQLIAPSSPKAPGPPSNLIVR